MERLLLTDLTVEQAATVSRAVKIAYNIDTTVRPQGATTKILISDGLSFGLRTELLGFAQGVLYGEKLACSHCEAPELPDEEVRGAHN